MVDRLLLLGVYCSLFGLLCLDVVVRCWLLVVASSLRVVLVFVSWLCLVVRCWCLCVLFGVSCWLVVSGWCFWCFWWFGGWRSGLAVVVRFALLVVRRSLCVVCCALRVVDWLCLIVCDVCSFAFGVWSVLGI